MKIAFGGEHVSRIICGNSCFKEKRNQELGYTTRKESFMGNSREFMSTLLIVL